MGRRLPLALLTLGVFGAIAVGGQLVRAGLVTDYVGVQPDYLLNGPSDPTCEVPFDIERQITVTWVDGDDAEAGFIVTRQGPVVNGTSTAQFQLPAQSGTGGTVTFTDTSVVPDAGYSYTVRSFLGPALSPAVSVTDGCTTQSVPAQPTEVEATGIGQHSIRITWATNSTNHEGFRVYRFSDDDPRPGVEYVSLALPEATSFDDYGADLPDPGLLSRTEYGYYVQAYNSRGPADGVPGGATLATATTWSEQPQVVNVQVGAGAQPTFTWELQDADPPPGSNDAVQTAVEVQVCAQAFSGSDGGDDDCAGQAWRWSTGQLPFTEQSIAYLHGYPLGGGTYEHPLDFSNDTQYYVRIRAWDDTGTPSEWATPAVPFFTLRPPSDAHVYDFLSSDGLTLQHGATHDGTYGGQVVLPSDPGRLLDLPTVSGALSSLENVTSVRLLQSASSPLEWYVRRSGEGDDEWVEVPGTGETGASWTEAANGLEWIAYHTGGDDPIALGSLALAINANHPPTVTQCRAVRLIGGVGEEFAFTVEVTDPDADFDYDLTQVQFDWDGGSGSTDWQSYGNGGPLTEFTASWPAEGSYTPTVSARDQYGEVSPSVACDTVLVGSATAAWLRTQDADVFSGSTIYGRSPAGQANATYLVQATGQIQEFSTQAQNCYTALGEACSTDAARTPGYGQIPLPQPGNTGQPLATILGSVDLGSEASGRGILGGRYGAVTHLDGSNTNLSTFFNGLSVSGGGRVLNGAIVHVRGNATLDATTTLANGGEGQSGAGLIVVEGDLFINAPITYAVQPVQVSLRRLASLGWLVRGNVYVSPSVWAVHPTDNEQACPDAASLSGCRPGVVGTFYLYDAGGGSTGGFFTGSSGSLDDRPLKLGGLVVAQRFALQRNWVSDTVPAELFSYDGRVFANPPPGLQDFAKALPRWKPLAPLP